VPKDSRIICGGRLGAMNGELWDLANPVSQSLTAACGALLQRTLSSLATRGTAMKKQNKQQNQQNAIEQRLFLKTRNGNIRSTRKQSTPKAEEGYCNEARLKAEHSLTVKPTKRNIQQNMKR
jgi:hypothetical protein